MSQTIYWGQFRWQRHTPDVRGYAGAIHSARFAVARAGWHSSWFKVKAACSVCPTVYCESKMKFLWGTGKLKVSSSYSDSLQKHVVKGKIQNLKSHDMHIFTFTANYTNGNMTCTPPRNPTGNYKAKWCFPRKFAQRSLYLPNYRG